MGVQTNFASIAPAIKQMVANELKDQYESATPIWNLFKKVDTEFASGKGFRVPSRFRRSTGVTYGNEGFSFNTPQAAVLDDMYVYPTAVGKAIEVTTRLIANVNSPESLIKGIGGIYSESSMALAKDMEWNVFGNGSGQRAIYKSGTTTLTLYNAVDDTPLSTYGSTKGSMQINALETYDAYDATGATFRNTFQALTVPTAKTITVAADPGLTDTDILVLQNGINKSFRGLAYLVNNDSGVFQLLSRSTYPQLKSPVNDLNGSAISVAEFTKTKALLEARQGGEGPSKQLTAIYGPAQKDALLRLGQNFKRFEGTATKFDGSFAEFGHGNTAFIYSVDCDEDRIYLLDLTEMMKFEEMPFGEYNFDGQQLRMKSGTSGYGSASGTSSVGWAGNLGVGQPRCFALIKRASVTGLATEVLANT